MKKSLLTLMVMAAMAVAAAAQTVGDKMFVYYGGRVSDGFIPSEIDSIVYSNYDNDSIWYDDVVTQVIYTADSIYRFPLAQIDSISFVRPATIYKPNAVVLEGEIRQYIVNSDGFNLTMAANTPSHLMPKVGDRLVTMRPDDQFPYYFAGEVRSAVPSDGGIHLTCDTLEFEDVVEQFADIIFAGGTEDMPGLAPHKTASSKGASTPWIPLLLPSFTNSLELSGINIQPIPKIRDIEPNITFGAGMSYSIVPQARAKLTWFIMGGLYVNGIMVIDNSISWSHHFNGEVSGTKEESFLPSPKEGPIGSTPFSWYVDAGWFASLSGSLVWETSMERKMRTTLSFIYDRAHPENNMARRITNPLSSNEDVGGKLYGDITAEGGLYVEAGVSLVRKFVAKVGAKASVGLKADAHNLRLWEGITEADKSPEFYDNIKDGGLTITPFLRLGGVWSVIEALPFGISGDFLKNDFDLGQPVNYYAVPSFDNVKAERVDSKSTTVMAQASLGHNVLLSSGVGFTVVNSKDDRVSTDYLPQTYSLFNQFPTASLDLKNVPLAGKYRICPMLRLFGKEVMASPDVELEAEIPVKITDFKQTGSQYKENGFSHNGRTYDYKYDVAVTVELSDNTDVADWGYVYLDPYGNLAHISLKNYGSPYTDTRYVYYRNESKSTVTLYEYVKYEGDSEYYYGEPKDYDVSHGLTYCPDDHHPHMIDLGLPSGTKWACCNVGASTPEGYGGYYAWGEVEEKAVYNDVTYQYCTGEDTDGDGYYDGYDTDCYGVWQSLGSDIAGTGYDVAHVRWGGSWVMPSLDQQVELLDNCNHEWTTVNGVNGRKFTSKTNGGSIFLPAAGLRWGVHLDDDYDGEYWSSTQHPSYSCRAYDLYFGSGGARWCYVEDRRRFLGRTVRPVSK